MSKHTHSLDNLPEGWRVPSRHRQSSNVDKLPERWQFIHGSAPEWVNSDGWKSVARKGEDGFLFRNVRNGRWAARCRGMEYIGDLPSFRTLEAAIAYYELTKPS